MRIRRAEPGDLEALVSLYAEARATIALLGIDQWQDGYPGEAVIAADIETGRGRVVEDENGELAGVFALCEGEDPTYRVIENGSWMTSEPYLTMHRTAIRVKNRGTGVSGMVVRYAKDCARRLGLKTLRIDTHEGNVVMRRMLEKNGFEYRGVIHLENGDPRVAYETVIGEENGESEESV